MTTPTHSINVSEPPSDVVKRLGVGDVVDQEDTHGTSVVGGGDGVEPLLPSSVPGGGQHRCDSVCVCVCVCVCVGVCVWVCVCAE